MALPDRPSVSTVKAESYCTVATDLCSNQENPRGCWVFLRFSFGDISNHWISCCAEFGIKPENPRFSWLLGLCISVKDSTKYSSFCTDVQTTFSTVANLD
jgi:hypothetical protein